MNLEAVGKPLIDGGTGRRFYRVAYFPTCAALVFLLTLLWAGVWRRSNRARHRISFIHAWSTVSGMSVAEVVVLALVVTLVAILLHPLQLTMVRFLEGTWPSWLGARPACWWQKRRRDRLAHAARPPKDVELTDEMVQRAGSAGHELRRRFPMPAHLIRPTALGNVLAAMEDGAGRAYGLDAVTAWPRLYPLLGESVRTLVDDRRDTLDATAGMAVTMAFTSMVSLVLLVWSQWWMLLALVPLGVALVAYWGAIQAASAYAEIVHVAFDLHRADLLAALRVEPPLRPKDERVLGEQWCDFWRQGIPLPVTLEYMPYKKESPTVSRENR